MKKLITMILILALILPAGALADIDPEMYEGAWTSHKFTTDGGVVLNSRLSAERRLKAYRHEVEHIENGDMYDMNYNEYGGNTT